WMKTLHRTLFLGSTGSQIIGSATLLLIIEIITGYCIWGKVAKARINSARHQGLGWWSGLKRSLRWRSPNMIMGCHTSGGFWSGIPLLLMALTGLTWSFGWYGEMVFSVLDPDGKLNLFHSIANIHTGNFIAPWSRLLWLICAIIGATLPITGYIIFFKSKSHK
ncbi:MAG: PepSY domain-containing protein, partial [Muribaculaceae bacterium]|nr:PepSY domain-containing protein [Muribaculaceae bacterium]